MDKELRERMKQAIIQAEEEKLLYGIAKAYGFLKGKLETEFNLARGGN